MPMLARDLNLPDCWIAAGFVRSLVWGHLHQRKPSALTGQAWRGTWPELTFVTQR